MKKSILFVTLILAAGTAAASETSTTTSSSVLDNFYVNYFGTFHGGNLNDVGSSYTQDRYGMQSGRAVNFDSELTTAYRITKDIGIGPDVPFVFFPVMGQGVALGDVGIKAYNAKTVDSNGLWVYTNFLIQAPTSTGSRLSGMAVAFKTTPAIRYSIPQTRWALGAWNELKEYAGVTSDKTFKVYTAPYVNYQFAPKLSLNLLYEMEWHHNVGDKAGSLSAYQTDLQPGVVWMVSPNFVVNPFLQFYTTNRATFDTAGFGANISATVL